MGILANENAISSGGYQISNSLRFQSASSQNLSRTPASAGNRQKWTMSLWVKRGILSTQSRPFAISDLVSNEAYFQFNSNDTFTYSDINSLTLTTTQVFRDPSAWYHIIIAIDTTQATAANRVLMYVNGQQVTAFSTATYPAQNSNEFVNTATATRFGSTVNNVMYFDGYMAEINFIDGQALTPSSFGSTDPTSGQWVAAKYTGTYGTNGFYLKFANGTSTTTLGTDSSGNGNNWTLNNFTRSAGVSDCWLIDVPSGNGSGSGTQPSSNYCVLNPLDKSLTATTTVSNSNLNIASTAVNAGAKGTIGVTSGKWYFECVMLTFNVGNTQSMVGVANQNWPNDYLGSTTGTIGYCKDATIYQNGSTGGTGTPTAYVVNDVLGVAFDAGTGVVSFYKNNVLQYTCNSIGTGYTFFPAISCQINSYAVNFGQRSFTYTPPSGYQALCTANLPVATIVKGNKYMDATLYTGNGGTQSIVNAAGFKPDLVWSKGRSQVSGNHLLTDSVRGTTKSLMSNDTGAEGTRGVTAFNSNGFTYIYPNEGGDGNSNGNTYVGWQWQAGQGSTSSNTNGSITSTVSVNATAGFSIVSYTGNGTSGATVGHGLGVAPTFVIVKERGAGGSGAWATKFPGAAATEYLVLNTTAAKATTNNYFTANPSSTVISLGNSSTNVSGEGMIAYCWTPIAGFSAIGSYTGNNSTDGPFVYCGFRPKFVLVKRTDTINDWTIIDTSRSPYNVSSAVLFPDLSDAETASGNLTIDILSNGFKLRATSTNANGGTYIYAAFAENPFANSNAR